jgi:BMFP domain-containing protein YqiC
MQIAGIMTLIDPKRIEAAKAKVKTRVPNSEEFGSVVG